MHCSLITLILPFSHLTFPLSPSFSPPYSLTTWMIVKVCSVVPPSVRGPVQGHVFKAGGKVRNKVGKYFRCLPSPPSPVSPPAPSEVAEEGCFCNLTPGKVSPFLGSPPTHTVIERAPRKHCVHMRMFLAPALVSTNCIRLNIGEFLTLRGKVGYINDSVKARTLLPD